MKRHIGSKIARWGNFAKMFFLSIQTHFFGRQLLTKRILGNYEIIVRSR